MGIHSKTVSLHWIGPTGQSQYKDVVWQVFSLHYNDVIMGTIAFQITSLTIVYSTVYSGADQRKHQSSASLALVRGIHRGPVNSPHKWPVTRKMFPFDDVIMTKIKRFHDCLIFIIYITYPERPRRTSDVFSPVNILWNVLLAYWCRDKISAIL